MLWELVWWWICILGRLGISFREVEADESSGS